MLSGKGWNMKNAENKFKLKLMNYSSIVNALENTFPGAEREEYQYEGTFLGFNIRQDGVRTHCLDVEIAVLDKLPLHDIIGRCVEELKMSKSRGLRILFEGNERDNYRVEPFNPDRKRNSAVSL
jgi:hypothetical protein